MINYLILFYALISSLFGGMLDPFYLPLFLIINCLCILFFSVKSKLPLFFYPLTLIFIFLGILSAWFQPVPESLAKTTTSQLGVSLESVFLAANALLWFGWVLGNPQGEKKRIGIFRTYGWVVASVGMVALICRVQRWPFPFTSPQAYGIFPNTNHMSNWLAIAAILLVGTVYADIRRKNFAPAIFSFLGILAALTCLAANSSRGGLAVFFLGLVLWAVGLATGGPDRRIGILLLAGAALAATVLLFQGARPLERMKKPWMGSATATIPSGSQETEETETLDFRLLLQRDALDLSADLPWLGTGPGNFRYLFPPYRHRTFSNQSTAIHPESDWLWLVCEFGWPAAILLFGGAFALGRAAGPGRNRESSLSPCTPLWMSPGTASARSGRSCWSPAWSAHGKRKKKTRPHGPGRFFSFGPGESCSWPAALPGFGEWPETAAGRPRSPRNAPRRRWARPGNRATPKPPCKRRNRASRQPRTTRFSAFFTAKPCSSSRTPRPKQRRNLPSSPGWNPFCSPCRWIRRPPGPRSCPSARNWPCPPTGRPCAAPWNTRPGMAAPSGYWIISSGFPANHRRCAPTFFR
ncbi:MAG: hypothetical protein EBT95_05540 [Verrucomicrobia bacterium]|nr:hypothetical protein [Verrucomicrobiota bacterium]